jgi:5-amino-6-(5-phosphoribosylamino)uracil reductase
MNRPYTIVVLAMTVDGKIADFKRSPAHFSSLTDRAHLEKQIALADGVLLGAGTLRAHGTTLSIRDPDLIQLRQQQQKPPQPVQIICSASGNINPELRFFHQPVPRWLLTTVVGAKRWQNKTDQKFERILIAELKKQESTSALTSIDWWDAFFQIAELGLPKLAILGGGELVASLLAEKLIDEFYLTICPAILGGADAPTPVGGVGLVEQKAQRLELIKIDRVGQEVFLRYRLLNE